jgi:hypothetical protein
MVSFGMIEFVGIEKFVRVMSGKVASNICNMID